MEHRLHDRYPASLDAQVFDIAAPDRTASGRIADISERGVCAVVSLEFPVGTVVKLQVADCCLFGHVIHCRPEGETYQIGIEVVRVLIGESNLARMLNMVLVEAMPSTPGVNYAAAS